MSRESLASVPDLDLDESSDGGGHFDALNTPCRLCLRPTLSHDVTVTLCVECAYP